MAGGRPGREQVDYVENRRSQVLTVLSPPTYAVPTGIAVNLGSLPELPGLENQTAEGF